MSECPSNCAIVNASHPASASRVPNVAEDLSRSVLQCGYFAGGVKSLFHFANTCAGFDADEHIFVRPLVLAEIGERLSDVVVHRDVSWSSILRISRCHEVAKKVDLMTLHLQLFAHSHSSSECDCYDRL